MRLRPTTCILFSVALAAAHGAALRAAAPGEAQNIPTVCPALEIQGREPANGSPESHQTISLVVLGTTRAKSGIIEIEQVLYGHHEAQTLQFREAQGQDERLIFFLAPSSYGDQPDFENRWVMEADELDAAKALCAARLDTLALGANSIFIGEEVDHSSFDVRKVKVLRTLNGQAFKPNEILSLNTFSAMRSGQSPRPHPGPLIYFLGDSRQGRPDEPTLHQGLSALPTELESAVIKALERRETYPIIDAPAGMQPPKMREVTFQGDLAGAFKLFDSQDEATQMLGQRYLFHHAQESRGPLIAAIEAAMFQTGPAKYRAFALQKTRIETLTHLETEKEDTGALAALAEKMIARLESNTEPVPMPVRDETNPQTRLSPTTDRTRMPEERTTEANHSLAWLLGQMDEAEVARRWDERLLKLRSQLQGWWQHEVALAVDVASIEQNRELAAALARMHGIKPVRSTAGLRHRESKPLHALAFSPDGAFLATADYPNEICIWSTKDWALQVTIPAEARRLVFSPDGKFLYVSGAVDSETIFSRYEWRTAHLDREYRNPSQWINVMHLSGDGRTMMTASYMDGSLVLWDTATGDKKRTALLPKISAAAALNADGKLWARLVKSGDSASKDPSTSVVESVDGKEGGVAISNDFVPTRYAFTPDGHYLLSLGNTEYERMKLTVHDLQKKGAPVASINLNGHFANLLVASPDSHSVAISDEGSQICVYGLPDLKPMWSTDFGKQGMVSKTVNGAAFSPDGKWLALANSEPTPRLLRADSFAEVIPYQGHPGRTRVAFFSADNQKLCSFGDDGSICHWEAATMKMIDRILPPQNFVLHSIREPDGKYALFVDRDPENLTGSPRPKTIQVMDAESGKMVSTAVVTIGSYAPVYWLPNGQMLVIGDNTHDSGLTRLDILSGKILSQMPYHNLRSPCYLSRDGLSLLTHLDPDERHSSSTPERIDLTSGTVTHPSVAGTGDTRTADGQTYQLLEASPMFGIPPKPKKLSAPRNLQILRSALSPDRRRLAVVTGRRIYIDGQLRQWDSNTPSMIRVHAADSLEMLCAFPAPTRWADVRFNGDGTQLAVINDNGTIERWELPR